MNALPAQTVKLAPDYDHVANFSGYYWPAQQRPEGLVVDFRLFAMGSQTLGYFPDKLATAKVPEHLIKAAGESEPPGFVLIVEPDGGAS